ncbi:MAG TPA: sulfite exporter TauE/SafE family protein [Burkholderiales bacterium]|nr:sulfite exporter TauE/SafE family protein [Burkholderiales bacterium]
MLIGGIFFLGGFVKGVIGLGLPTIVMGLLSIAMPVAQAAATIVVPAVATNIWQILAGPALLALAKRFALMMLGVVVGTFATIGFLTQSSAAATVALGGVLAAYGLLGFVPSRLEIGPRTERWLSPIVGLVNGAISGASGVFVIPSVPYLNSLRLGKEELIQAIGIHAFVCPLALGCALALRGRFEAGLAASSLMALLPALAGMYAGQRVRGRLKPEIFRRCFFMGLIALGGYMVLRSVS